MEALVLVDLQNDFLPGGALPVPGGDQVIPVANRLQQHYDLVLATQDWHPPDHGSFAANHRGKRVGDIVELGGLQQILWPVHCVQETPGAAINDKVDLHRVERIFFKGIDPDIDSYSAIFDNGHRRSTGLSEYLHERSIRDVSIAGLATDYCVLYTVRDARRLGLNTTVILDGCRGINLTPGDVDRAIAEMKRLGAHMATSEQILRV